MNEIEIQFELNGRAHSASVAPELLLADFLRRDLALRGTKTSCEVGGVRLLHGAAGRAAGERLHHPDPRDRRPLADHHRRSRRRQRAGPGAGGVLGGRRASECGFCTPGMILAARALLDENPDPSEEDIKTALDGNIWPLHGLPVHHPVDRPGRGIAARAGCIGPAAARRAPLGRRRQGARRARVHRRPDLSRNALRAGPAQPPRPRPHPRHRHRGGRSPSRCRGGSHLRGPHGHRAVSRPAGEGHPDPGHRQGPLRRRRGGRSSCRDPRSRHCRPRAHPSGVRAAAGADDHG